MIADQPRTARCQSGRDGIFYNGYGKIRHSTARQVLAQIVGAERCRGRADHPHGHPQGRVFAAMLRHDPTTNGSEKDSPG